MKTIDNRIIWIFREPRSGSTTSAEVISKLLQRTHIFVDDSPEFYIPNKLPTFGRKEDDEKIVYSTHFFPALKSMVNYNDPILIRISRKDVVEQCMSLLACQYMDFKFFNMSTYNFSDNREIFERFSKTKIEIKKEDVLTWAGFKMNQNRLWNKISPIYENQTIYYEDIINGIDIPLIGLYNVNLTTVTQKLPDYKKEVFVNYDSVKEWLNPVIHLL